MKALSFRSKIALQSALVSGVVLLGFASLSWWLLRQQKIQAVDTEIRSLGARHPGWLANPSGLERLSASLNFIFGEDHEGQVIFQVRKAYGDLLYVSPNWPKEMGELDYTLAEAPGALSTSSNDLTIDAYGAGRGAGRGFGPGRGGGPVVFTKTARFLTAGTRESTWRLGIMGNDDLRLVVGLDYGPVQAEINRMRNVFLGTIPFALLLVGGGGWIVAGRAMRPIRTIARTAEQVTAQGLARRIPCSDADPEIRQLIDVLNGMMNRLEASFQQATRFSADASHELKTPLAIMQGELENAIQSARTDSSEQRVFSNLLEEVQHLKRITGNLLLLAQADSGQLKLASEELDLGKELETMVEDARILAEEKELRFEVRMAPGIRIAGDRGLLRMAIMNLVKNAIIYNEPQGRIQLTLTPDFPAKITVCNTGPGIPAADQPHIFERFYRGRTGETCASQGLGLGLSLAREIILAHHGKLELIESGPGHTCFSVELPGLSRA